MGGAMAGGRLGVWMDVMRGVEPVIDDHERLFDAWGAGGVDGLVIGPLTFADGSATFDPDPAVYRRLGVDVPPAPANRQPERRAGLDRALRAASDRGWQGWLFQPGVGGGPMGGPHAARIGGGRGGGARGGPPTGP